MVTVGRQKQRLITIYLQKTGLDGSNSSSVFQNYSRNKLNHLSFNFPVLRKYLALGETQ